MTEEDTVSFREHQDKVRENLGICVTIFGIIMVAVIVTTLKIIFFDKETYPSVFFTPEEIMAMKNKTVGFTLFTKLRINCRQSEVGGKIKPLPVQHLDFYLMRISSRIKIQTLLAVKGTLQKNKSVENSTLFSKKN